jgi:hypothetical protein
MELGVKGQKVASQAANSDNLLKMHKRLLEIPTLKGNPTRDKTRKFIHI